jgi:hypothetical protein
VDPVWADHDHGHVASRAVLTLARARATILEELGRSAGELAPPPVSVIVFGSSVAATSM